MSRPRASASGPARRPTAEPLSFATAKAWDAWLREHHASSKGIRLAIAKKGAGAKSVTYPEAVEIALTWGWIDGQKEKLDEHAWVQRFGPRVARSPWSQTNKDKAQALLDAGKMHAPGIAEIERAKKDGRWDRAYEPASKMQMPEALAAALRKDRRAAAFYETINAANRYAILYRVTTAKKEETRAALIARFVEMLARGETLHPQRAKAAAKAKKRA